MGGRASGDRCILNTLGVIHYCAVFATHAERKNAAARQVLVGFQCLAASFNVGIDQYACLSGFCVQLWQLPADDTNVARGLDAKLASEVAAQLMTKDALGAHARDELGISDTLSARPVQAAFASAGSFTVGAALPLLLVLIVPLSRVVWVVSGSSLFFLALLGTLAARAGGSPVWRSVARVTFWGALAMALTAGVGALFGAAL